MDKIRVGILFGGRSVEHEISLLSALNIIDSLDREKYEPVSIFLTKEGGWPSLIQHISDIDVAFPVLHGPYGEDGTMQGFLKLANIPFVGAGVLGSAVGMDKDVMKRLLREAGVPVARFLVIREGEPVDVQAIITELDLPLFVKPANAGSSVGVAKVKEQAALSEAISGGFQYDRKVICEEYIPGREIECAVLGGDDVVVSVPGEIIPTHEFYSYEAKYLDENGAQLVIPADLPADTIKKIQELAKKTFQVLECFGMARVDFFVTNSGEIFVNEINTIPGFTSISMYPKMMEASGVAPRELVGRLIQLAFERHTREQSLRTHYE